VPIASTREPLKLAGLEPDLVLLGPRMAGRAAVVVQPLEPGLVQLLQASRVDAAAGEDAARRDGVHGVSGRESVSDLTRHVGSEHELEAAAPVRWNGQHTMRLDRLVTPARTLDHIRTFI
jgi:hypothetical protein